VDELHDVEKRGDVLPRGVVMPRNVGKTIDELHKIAKEILPASAPPGPETEDEAIPDPAPPGSDGGVGTREDWPDLPSDAPTTRGPTA